jgi:hypothetical protein
MSDKPSKFNMHLGDQLTLSDGLYEEMYAVINKYDDVMTAVGVLGVLDAIKFEIMVSMFFDEVEDDEDGTETED